MALYFPIFVDDEGNQDLYAEFIEVELKDTLQIFQKDKAQVQTDGQLNFI
jgi:hypothetical protein